MLLLFMGCEKRSEPVVINRTDSKLSCLRLNILELNGLNSHLKTLYSFNEKCKYSLSLKFKRDIVCNSTQNVGMKSMGNFPKSFLELEVREGMSPIYSYYIDLFHNANIEDVEEGFKRLKRDILKK